MGEATMFNFHKLRTVLTIIYFILAILYINYELNSMDLSTLFKKLSTMLTMNRISIWYIHMYEQSHIHTFQTCTLGCRKLAKIANKTPKCFNSNS